MRQKLAIYNAIIFLFILLLSACSNENITHNNELKAAEYIKNQEYKEAKSIYENILKTNPKNKEMILSKIMEIDSILLYREKEAKYQNVIGIADQFFNDMMYDKAKHSYQKAEQILADKSYPKDQIMLIEEILAENDEAKSAYYVIVGSFLNKNYAERMHNKMKSNGYESYIIDRPSGFNAVSMSSHPNLTDAWNNLPNARFVHEDAWVLFYESD